MINLVHSDGADFYPIDYRIYAPEADGLTKNDHFRHRLLHTKSTNHIQAQTLLFDIGISSADLPHIFERLYRVDESRSLETGGAEGCRWLNGSSTYMRAV